MSGVPIVGDIIDFAGDVIEEVGDFVSDVAEFVIDAVTEVVEAIDDAITAIGDVLGDLADVAQVLVERYAIQAALVAMGIPPVFAAPMSAGIHTIARGGTPEDAIKAAATVAVVQQVGAAVQGGMEAANADAIAAGGEAVYSAAEISAATSAATSAVATAAAGGDLEDAVLGAAIGGVTGVAATEVYQATGSLAAANFVRVTMQSVLQGVDIEQAILMGASASMVAYLQSMDEIKNKIQEITNDRAAAITAYKSRVEEYNKNLALYNEAKANGEVATANALATQLNASLPIINNLAAQIGQFNSQLATLSTQYQEAQNNAQEEAQATNFDFTAATEEQLAAEQADREALAEQLVTFVSESDIPGLGNIQIGGDLPLALNESIRTLPLVGENIVSQTDTGDEVVRVISGFDDFGNEYSYQIIIDKQTGEVGYQYSTGNVSGDPSQGIGGETIFTANRPVFNLASQPTEVSDLGELVGMAPTLTEEEIASINQALGETRTEEIRNIIEGQLFEQELAQFEEDLANAQSAAEQAKARADFIRQQQETLGEAGQLPGQLEEQLQQELEDILAEYENQMFLAQEAENRLQEVQQSQEDRAGEISDQDIIELLNLTPEEAESYGFGTGGGEGFEETDIAPISEEPPEITELETPTLEAGPVRFDETGKPIISTVTVRPDVQGIVPQQGQPSQAEAGISPRVSGEELIGILGEKEPLFGGDEDEQQRTVWNRRSLRLRRALGL